MYFFFWLVTLIIRYLFSSLLVFHFFELEFTDNSIPKFGFFKFKIDSTQSDNINPTQPENFASLPDPTREDSVSSMVWGSWVWLNPTRPDLNPTRPDPFASSSFRHGVADQVTH